MLRSQNNALVVTKYDFDFDKIMNVLCGAIGRVLKHRRRVDSEHSILLANINTKMGSMATAQIIFLYYVCWTLWGPTKIAARDFIDVPRHWSSVLITITSISAHVIPRKGQDRTFSSLYWVSILYLTCMQHFPDFSPANLKWSVYLQIE